MSRIKYTCPGTGISISLHYRWTSIKYGTLPLLPANSRCIRLVVAREIRLLDHIPVFERTSPRLGILTESCKRADSIFKPIGRQVDQHSKDKGCTSKKGAKGPPRRDCISAGDAARRKRGSSSIPRVCRSRTREPRVGRNFGGVTTMRNSAGTPEVIGRSAQPSSRSAGLPECSRHAIVNMEISLMRANGDRIEPARGNGNGGEEKKTRNGEAEREDFYRTGEGYLNLSDVPLDAFKTSFKLL